MPREFARVESSIVVVSGYDHSPMLLAFVWAESEFDLGLRQFHSDGLRRWWKKRVRRREMGKLTIIVLTTVVALPRVWTKLHHSWL